MGFADNMGSRPTWLTFDCYGTLIQWDEGLVAAVERILGKKQNSQVSSSKLISVYDRHEHELEAHKPHRTFRDVAGQALQMAMHELGLAYDPGDIEELTSSIALMPPFPEVIPALAQLKRMGFRLCIVSNTDDDIIAGNVAQMRELFDRVITAQQARAYKPTRAIFDHAHRELGVGAGDVVHICASPHLDLRAARDIGFRCVWIDRHTARRPLSDYTPDAVFDKLDRVPVFFKQLCW